MNLQLISRCDALERRLQQLQARLNQSERENQVLRMRLQQSEVRPSSEVNYPVWKQQVDPEQEAYQRLASQALQTAENVLGTQQQEGEWEGYGSSCN